MTSDSLNCKRTSGPYFFSRKIIFCENFLPHFSRVYHELRRKIQHIGVWIIIRYSRISGENFVLVMIRYNRWEQEHQRNLLAFIGQGPFTKLSFVSLSFTNTYTTTHTRLSVCITNFFLCCFNILYTLQTERRITHSITC